MGHRGSNFVFILPCLLTTVLSGTNEHLEIFTTNAPCLKSFTIEIQGRIEFAENTLLREKKSTLAKSICSTRNLILSRVWYKARYVYTYMERKSFACMPINLHPFVGGKYLLFENQIVKKCNSKQFFNRLTKLKLSFYH